MEARGEGVRNRGVKQTRASPLALSFDLIPTSAKTATEPPSTSLLLDLRREAFALSDLGLGHYGATR